MWYVSHAWSGSLEDLVVSLQQELAPEPEPTEPALPVGFKKGVFVWIGKRGLDRPELLVYTFSQQPANHISSHRGGLVVDLSSAPLCFPTAQTCSPSTCTRPTTSQRRKPCQPLRQPCPRAPRDWSWWWTGAWRRYRGCGASGRSSWHPTAKGRFA